MKHETAPPDAQLQIGRSFLLKVPKGAGNDSENFSRVLCFQTDTRMKHGTAPPDAQLHIGQSFLLKAQKGGRVFGATLTQETRPTILGSAPALEPHECRALQENSWQKLCDGLL